MNRIFVYGTLLSGLGNWKHYLNNPESKLVTEAVVRGEYEMISLGGFPAVLLGGGPTEIKGEIYEVSDRVARSIDMLEGYPGFYGKTEVMTNEGKADMYYLDDSWRNDYPSIPSGNWKEYINKAY